MVTKDKQPSFYLKVVFWFSCCSKAAFPEKTFISASQSLLQLRLQIRILRWQCSTWYHSYMANHSVIVVMVLIYSQPLQHINISQISEL